MNVSLTSELEGLVKKLVDSGRYSSASEVVRESLRLLEWREEIRQLKLQQLREAIKEGVESGPGIPFDVEEFIAHKTEGRNTHKKAD